jgi:hypothetical protein
MERLLPRLNGHFRADVIADFPSRKLERSPSLVALLRELDVIERDEEEAFVAQMPPSMQAAAMAIIRANVEGERKQMTVSWAPGYDWELTIWETKSTRASDGGITIQIKSRYPSDAHPNH